MNSSIDIQHSSDPSVQSMTWQLVHQRNRLHDKAIYQVFSLWCKYQSEFVKFYHPSTEQLKRDWKLTHHSIPGADKPGSWHGMFVVPFLCWNGPNSLMDSWTFVKTKNWCVSNSVSRTPWALDVVVNIRTFRVACIPTAYDTSFVPLQILLRILKDDISQHSPNITHQHHTIIVKKRYGCAAVSSWSLDCPSSCVFLLRPVIWKQRKSGDSFEISQDGEQRTKLYHANARKGTEHGPAAKTTSTRASTATQDIKIVTPICKSWHWKEVAWGKNWWAESTREIVISSSIITIYSPSPSLTYEIDIFCHQEYQLMINTATSDEISAKSRVI